MVSLSAESWTWWSLVLAVTACRFVSRYMQLHSVRRYQADEYLVLLAFAFYTTMTATIRIVGHTSSNLLPPGFDLATLTPQDRKERVYGSKLILVVEQCQIASIWLCKLCLIMMYNRLTTLRKENIAVKALGVYVVIGFIVMEILYFGVWCTPFSNYWALPTPNPQCDAATNHLITNAVLNLSSDCLMLAIGLPMFLRMSLPWRKKIPVICVFSLGIFVIIAAILNKVYSFTEPFGSAWTFWYVRESSTAMIVTNLPFVWTLWRRVTGVRASNTEVMGHDSLAPSEISRYGRPKRVVPTAGAYGSSSEEDMDDVELGGAISRTRTKTSSNMTFAEMLRGEEVEEGGDDGELSPYTHPQLFYGRRQGSASEAPRSRVEQAILHDSAELPTVRCGSTPLASKDSTPSSSGFPPQTGSLKSPGSFV